MNGDRTTELPDETPVDAPSTSLRNWFFALQSQAHIYGGTVPTAVIAQRRKKNREARAARRGNTAAIHRQARANFAANRKPKPRRVINPLGRVVVDAEVVE